MSIAAAKTEQTDRQIAKAVRLSEPDTGQQTLTTVQHSTAADVKTGSRSADSDLRSNYHLLFSAFVSLTTTTCHFMGAPGEASAPIKERLTGTTTGLSRMSFLPLR